MAASCGKSIESSEKNNTPASAASPVILNAENEADNSSSSENDELKTTAIALTDAYGVVVKVKLNECSDSRIIWHSAAQNGERHIVDRLASAEVRLRNTVQRIFSDLVLQRGAVQVCDAVEAVAKFRGKEKVVISFMEMNDGEAAGSFSLCRFTFSL